MLEVTGAAFLGLAAQIDPRTRREAVNDPAVEVKIITVEDYNYSIMDPVTDLSMIPFPVTICDPEGILIYMNPAAETLFAKDGGRALLGTSLYECHAPELQELIQKNDA